jgi:hypothetical protein
VRGILEVSSVIDQQLAHGATFSNWMILGGGFLGLAMEGSKFRTAVEKFLATVRAA